MIYKLICFYDKKDDVNTLNKLSADEIIEKYLNGFGEFTPDFDVNGDCDIDTEDEDISKNEMMSMTTDGKYIVQKYEGEFIDIYKKKTREVIVYADIPCKVYHREKYILEVDPDATEEQIQEQLKAINSERELDELARFYDSETLLDTIEEGNSAELIYYGETIRTIKNE